MVCLMLVELSWFLFDLCLFVAVVFLLRSFKWIHSSMLDLCDRLLVVADWFDCVFGFLKVSWCFFLFFRGYRSFKIP